MSLSFIVPVGQHGVGDIGIGLAFTYNIEGH